MFKKIGKHPPLKLKSELCVRLALIFAPRDHAAAFALDWDPASVRRMCIVLFLHHVIWKSKLYDPKIAFSGMCLTTNIRNGSLKGAILVKCHLGSPKCFE